MENMKRELADAIQDGRDPSVQYVTMSVKFQIVITMVTAWLEIVSAVGDTQANFVR